MSITQEKSSLHDVNKNLLRYTSALEVCCSNMSGKTITSIVVKQYGQSLVLTASQPSVSKLFNLTLKALRPYVLSRRSFLS